MKLEGFLNESRKTLVPAAAAAASAATAASALASTTAATAAAVAAAVTTAAATTTVAATAAAATAVAATAASATIASTSAAATAAFAARSGFINGQPTTAHFRVVLIGDCRLEMLRIDVDERETAAFDDSRILSAVRRKMLNEFVFVG